MARRTPKPTAQEMANQIITGYSYDQPRSDQHGNEYTGDIFYSDLHARTKAVHKYNYTKQSAMFQQVCDLLREAGFWVHS